ncbi:AAA family ATPase [Vibrio fluvialis]|uniref:AAA family ATPase n=1 Tax=Vibrio fluvialis TaxID=676 RepID=UPI001EEC5513|nr:AAA family ATPase [Vibrio fluvialis]MCG6399333.1 AAA family ATPase [Vibrio fluvialis]
MTTENKQSKIKNQRELWDAFLKRWPIEKLKELTLEQYVSTEDQDTFTYWLETKTRPIGSIQGNTSAKFGIYKRNSEGKEQNGIAHGDVYTWRTRYGDNEQKVFDYVKSALINIVEAAMHRDLEAIDKIDFAPMVKWKIAFLYQDQNNPVLINTFFKPRLQILTSSDNSASFPDMYRKLVEMKREEDLLEFGVKCWEIVHQKLNQTESVPLNQILYGPPGTGKTYHTIEAAVNAANPQFIWDSREELKGEYDRLVSEKRIRFVTFHQSYGYEEFVEGLCPTTTEDNQIEYFVKPGVFKQICNDATASGSKKPLLANSNPRIWKLSIDGVKASKVRKYCFDNNIAAIGWGESGDMSSEQRSGEEENYFEQLGSLAKSSITEFSSRMAKGDIVVCVKGQWAIQAVGIVSGDYQFRKEGVEDRDDFCHVMPVEWLATGLDVDLYELNNNTRLTLKTCYELTRFTSTELFEHLEKNGVVLSKQGNTNSKKENYVLVIDEINRGNISKIFGELITLIEPSKRKGASEALELVLPNSGKPFSVPDNLFLIGTMNTADRSLAMMDTALRRRFDFVEMMPKPEVFAETSKVKGIDLQRLLRALNQRIEILYDREHTLGHAFFMPVKELVDDGDEEQAFSALVSVFQNKIIPLLEEYFFEDWSKIRLVLADNQKKSQDLQFVSEQVQNTQQLNDLFGNNHELEQYGQSITKYTLADKEADVWTKPESYIGIYSTLVSSAE